VIRTAAVPSPVGPSPLTAQPPEDLTPEDHELKQRLEQLLRAHGDNLAEVARTLGKDRKQIYRWMSRFGLPRKPGS
jgi:transcriptional regulator with GAF, ATPase, and Fis domain